MQAKRLLVRCYVPLVVMSRYLAPTVRESLAEEGMSHIDATGNMLVQASRPAL